MKIQSFYKLRLLKFTISDKVLMVVCVLVCSFGNGVVILMYSCYSKTLIFFGKAVQKMEENQETNDKNKNGFFWGERVNNGNKTFSFVRTRSEL